MAWPVWRHDRQQSCLALGFYLDATPTSSYLKMLYKNPQAEFPYADLIGVNAAGGSQILNTSCSIPGSSTGTGTSMS